MEEKSVMVLPGHAQDLRFWWQGSIEKQGCEIETWRNGRPKNKYGDDISLFTTDLITPWDYELAVKVTAFRDMVNLIDRLKDALDKDWQELKKDLPVVHQPEENSLSR